MECPFDMIVEAAQLVRDKLQVVGLEGYPKTTGGDGMHVYVPLEPVYTYDQVRSFAEILSHLVVNENPALFTTPRAVAKRKKGRVYFDYMQIAQSKTIAAPYVVRAFPGAPVSTPLEMRSGRVFSRATSPSGMRLNGSGAPRPCSNPCWRAHSGWRTRWNCSSPLSQRDNPLKPPTLPVSIGR